MAKTTYDLLGIKPPTLTKASTAGLYPTASLNVADPSATLSPVPAATTAPETTTTPTQGDVLNSARNLAMSGGNNLTAQNTSNLTNELLKNPNLGFDQQAFVQGNLDTDARARASAIDNWSQKTAGSANLGIRDRQFQQLALQSAMERGDLEKNLTVEASNQSRDNLLKAITAGTGTAELENTINTSKVNNLVNTVGAGEGTENRTWQSAESALARGQELTVQGNDLQGQKDIETLKGKIASGALLSAQDFQASQSALDRSLETFSKNGDWASVLEVTKLKGALDAEAQKSQQTWATGERVGTQSWSTGERLSDQDYKTGVAYIANQNALALQSNDIAAQDRWNTAKNQLELTKQTNDFTHDEKMTYLNSQLAEAKATGDQARTKDIMDYQAKISFTEDERKNGYAVAAANLQNSFAESMAQGDFERSAILQKNQFDFQASESAMNRTIDNARLALEEKGMNMDWIQKAVADGTVSPDNALTALNSFMKDKGIVLTAPDPEAYKKAADATFNNMKYQFGLTHPELVHRSGTFATIGGKATDISGTLTAAGLTEFNKYINDNQGQTNTTVDNVSDLLTGTKDSTTLRNKAAGDPTYDGLLATASNLTEQGAKNVTVGENWLRDNDYLFKSIPAVGKYINVDGKLYRVDSGPTGLDGTHINTQYYQVTDVTTGKPKFLAPAVWKYQTSTKPGAYIVDSIGQIDNV